MGRRPILACTSVQDIAPDKELYYTPDIRSMWGYIVFAFPFVCTYIRSFVRLSITGSKFLH